MQVAESELKTFILDSGLVARKDVDAADAKAKTSKQSVGDVLVSEGILSSDALRRIKAYVLGIPFVNLKDSKISFEILSLIPEPIARTHNIIAFKKNVDSLEVAMLDTEDLAAVDSVRKTTGLKIMSRLTDEDSIKHALLQYQKNSVT
jgi:type IV pilus assembly protein PilB